MKIPVGDRMKAASISPDFLQSILNALTPIQIANAFPNYYKRQLPDVSNFVTSNILARNGGNWNQTGGGEGGSAYPYYDGETKQGGVTPAGTPLPTIQEMKEKLLKQGIDVDGTLNLVKQGAVLEGDERMAALKGMSDDELKAVGMLRTEDESGKTIIQMAPSQYEGMSEAQVLEEYKKEFPKTNISPRERATLDFIAKREGSKDPNVIFGDVGGKGGTGQYSQQLKNMGYTKPLTEMTITEVRAMQKDLIKLTKGRIGKGDLGTSAVGSGQMIGSTLETNLKALGIPQDQWDNIKFDKDLQDRLTLQNFKTMGIGDPNAPPSTWNHGVLGQQYESLDTRKHPAMSQSEMTEIEGKSAIRPENKDDVTPQEALRKLKEAEGTRYGEELTKKLFNQASPTSSEFIQSSSDDRNQTIINEQGYSVPVTGTMMHEGHGRTSEFGYGRGRLHAGVDIYSTDPETGQLRVGSNAPVIAPMDAKVTMIMKDRGRAGNYIEIQDKNGNRHRFLHTDESPALNPTTGEPWKVGESVTQGQTITNITGSGTKFDQKVKELGGDINAAVNYFDQNGWGSVNKPHLHYEVRDSRGKLLDPSVIFPEYSGENKENITFSNRNDKLKHLLVTGQITKDDYDKQMQNDPKVSVKQEDINLENTPEVSAKQEDTNLENTPKKKKPLSIIEYSRPTEDDGGAPPPEPTTIAEPVPTVTEQTPVAETPAESKEVVVAAAPPVEPKETTAATPPPPPEEVRKYALGGNIYEPNEDMTLVETDTGKPIAQVDQNEKIEKTGGAIQVTPETKLKADELTNKYDSSTEMEDRMANIEDNMQNQQSPDKTNQVVQKAREPEKAQTDPPYKWRESLASAERPVSPSFNRAMARSKFFGEGHHFTRSAPSSQS